MDWEKELRDKIKGLYWDYHKDFLDGDFLDDVLIEVRAIVEKQKEAQTNDRHRDIKRTA